MKTYLTLLFVILIAFASCKKCKTCTSVYTTTCNFNTDTVVTAFDYEICGYDLTNEDGKTTTVTIISEKGTAIRVCKTTCK